MNPSDDIANLFQKFGGATNSYQELSAQQAQQRSAERWPLVSALNESSVGEVAPVQRRTPAAAITAPAVAGATSSFAQAATPQSAAGSRPGPVPAPAPTATSAVVTHHLHTATPTQRASIPSLASRSPLAGLTGLGVPAAPPAEPDALRQRTLPDDLPSVFARLSGAAQRSVSPSPPPAAWQPRKGGTA